jgi:hypothetical protein
MGDLKQLRRCTRYDDAKVGDLKQLEVVHMIPHRHDISRGSFARKETSSRYFPSRFPEGSRR